MAIKYLHEEKMVARKSWENRKIIMRVSGGDYCMTKHTGSLVGFKKDGFIMEIRNREEAFGVWTPTTSDMFVNDWYLI